jgi:ATP-dependent Clp protease adaptor protein ClpS
MFAVHERGLGTCGVYTEEVAETKVSQVHGKARKAGFPLRCSMEEE